MLTTGIRTPVGIKIFGLDLKRDRGAENAWKVSSSRFRACSVYGERAWPAAYFVDFDLKRREIAGTA
jgi:Cu(I)/Ag(I) efflux system membrane protein CusA/SilA